MALDGTKDKRKPSRRSSANEKAFIEEAVLSASVCVMKYKNLWMLLDCRELSDHNIDDMADQFVEVTDITVSLCEEQAMTGALEKACTSAASDAAHILQSLLAWSTYDTYTRARDLNDVTEDDANEGDVEMAEKEDDEDLIASVGVVLNVREKLVDVLQSWLTLGETADDSPSEGTGSSFSTSEMCRVLQRDAFSMIGTLRTLYPVRQNQYRHVGDLAFSPSQEILAGLRKVFELDGARIKRRIKHYSAFISEGASTGDRTNEKQATAEVEALTKLLVDGLLLPLSNSMMFDIENLNRRQAAAVFCYYVDPSPLVVDTVKGLMKCLKDSDIVKYLEVQMVALKGIYTENVVTLSLEQRQLEAEGDLDNYLAAERVASAAISAGTALTLSLAKKLVVTMGVGKAKGVALNALVNFFKAGIDVCVNQLGFAGFARVLEQYLRLLPPSNVRALGEYLESKETALSDISTALESNDAVGDSEIESLLDFRAQLTGRARIRRRESGTGTGAGDGDASSQGSPPGRSVKAGPRFKSKQAPKARSQKRQTSILESVHEDDEDEEEDDTDIPLRRQSIAAKAPPRAKAVKKPVVERAPPVEGSRRSSRGEATKRISYSDGKDGEEEEDEEEKDEEEEEEEDRDSETEAKVPASRSMSSSRASRNPPAGYSQRASKSSQEQDLHDTSDEAQDDESIEKSASPLPLAVRPVPRPSSSATNTTYGGASKRTSARSWDGNAQTVEATVKEKKIEKQWELEKEKEENNKKPSKPSTSTSSSSSLSRVNTVHLGLELEESLDWPGSQDGESERSSAQDEDDFYKDTNYTRKRDLGPNSSAQAGGKKSRVENTSTRARAPVASKPEERSRSDPKSDTSEESMPAPRRASSRGKQVPEPVQDPPEDEPDLFAGLALPSRKRYR
jgi:hypothetical protein